MPRPPFEDRELVRDKYLQFRVSAQEIELLTAKAQQMGISVSDLFRILTMPELYSVKTNNQGKLPFVC